METFSALLAICAGNSPVSGEFTAQRPVTRSFDVFFDVRLIKRLSKHSRGWWFETLSHPLWRHRNDTARQWHFEQGMHFKLIKGTLLVILMGKLWENLSGEFWNFDVVANILPLEMYVMLAFYILSVEFMLLNFTSIFCRCLWSYHHDMETLNNLCRLAGYKSKGMVSEHLILVIITQNLNTIFISHQLNF